ncbi:Cys-tRNA(Pro) deacylase [Neobacillus sp. SM06]|uniref:Cys-tRNA(Pro) deacylase n=1 Tax=Neobacillus sp. SM06 TaxID=3422492 RepID=UPI003D277F1E
MAQTKTNAMRLLDAQKIPYEMVSYDANDGKIDGVSVAAKMGRSSSEVFKTLVAQGASKAIVIFVIPVSAELDLKKAAKVSGEKKVEMVPVKDIQKWTGYIRGGCSPIGMKKDYRTFIDQSGQALDSVVVSGGKIGLQIVINPNQLKKVTHAEFVELIK